MGIAQLVISALGVYASWDNLTDRVKLMGIYTVGCFFWVTIDILYMLLLVVSKSQALRNFGTGLIASNTFANLAKPVHKLLDVMGGDASFFTLFLSASSILFSSFAAYWALSLYNETTEILKRSQVLTPLLARPVPPTTMSRLADLTRGRNTTTSAPRGNASPFSGRGHRLGSS